MIREATTADIPQIQQVRNSVAENRLSDPALVSDAACERFLTVIGKGWVYVLAGKIVGFAIIDLAGKNIWALFVDPMHDRKGIGSYLHNTMLRWYFEKFDEPLLLGTDPKTRAAEFYRRKGWTEVGNHGRGEIKFTMKKESWIKP